MLINFTSIFELLCAYNLVNAVTYADEKSAFRFLDLANPLRFCLEDDLRRGEQLSKNLLTSFKGESNSKSGIRFIVATIIHAFYKLNYRLAFYHENVMPKIYLIGGIYCFSYLLFAGFCEDMPYVHKFSLTNWSTLAMYFLFIFLGITGSILPIKIHRYVGYSRIVFLTLVVLIAIIYFLNVFGSAKFILGFVNVWLLFGVLLLAFAVLRREIVRRKFYIATFSSIVLVVPIMCTSNINYGHYYIEVKENMQKVFKLNHDNTTILIISSIALALFPFLWDILYHSLSMAISRFLNWWATKLLNKVTIGDLDTNLDTTIDSVNRT